MVQYCVAYGCKEKAAKGSTVSFHSFPADEKIKQKWVLALKRENFNPSKHSRLCSKHFEPDCFDKEAFGRGLKLKANAIPSVFDFPDHLKKIERKRKAPRERIIEDSSPETVPETVPDTFTSMRNQKQKGKRPRLSYIGDFKKTALTPEEKNKFPEVARKRIDIYKKKMKTIKQKLKRTLQQNKNLKALCNHLQDKKLLSENAAHTLQSSFSSGVAEMLQRAERGKTKEEYSSEIRAFALTLNFYSAKAYNYVRKMFVNALPHPSTIRKWYKSVDGNPGFNEEAFAALKARAAELSSMNKKTVCSLMVDEMAIRKHVEFDGKTFVGYVDYGTNLDDDSLPIAKEALVFMVVAMNGSWKIPIGYFLIDSLSGTERANLVVQCLKLLHDAEVTIASLTFDGAASNISMAENLGASFACNNLKNWIEDPITQEHIFIFFDPSHMVKCVRNCLASKGSIADGQNLIQWKFISALEHIQNAEKLKAATKLSKRHINWFREKMKVKLAVQTLSQSVADALRFCAQDLQLQDFQGSESTSKFIEIFNNLFDILNSRNLLAKNFKSPLKRSNFEEKKCFLLDVKSYILSLRETIGGIPVHQGRRKTGFLGFLVCIESVLGLFERFVETKVLNFVLTYKISQDHLEVFFSAIRSRGGHNNNPTARQFRAAFKRLLVHAQVRAAESANCVEIDGTSILSVKSSPIERSCPEFQYVENSSERDHDYFALSLESNYATSVVEYIAGFVIRKIKRKINCIICLDALCTDSSEASYKLIDRKNMGGLTIPSSDVVHICKAVELECKIQFASRSSYKGILLERLLPSALRKLNCSVFEGLKDHILAQVPINNHRAQLIKSIALEYAKIRFYHEGNLLNEEISQNRIRSVHTKYILFNHQ